jgi:hypothetical protein
MRLVLVLCSAHRLMAPSTKLTLIVQDTHSSKSEIEVAKSGFSSNVHSLQSPSNPPYHMYDLSNHCTNNMIITRLLSPNFIPHIRPWTAMDAACYTPRQWQWYGPTNTRHPGLNIPFLQPGTCQLGVRATYNCVPTDPNHSKPTQMCLDASSNQNWPIYTGGKRVGTCHNGIRQTLATASDRHSLQPRYIRINSGPAITIISFALQNTFTSL